MLGLWLAGSSLILSSSLHPTWGFLWDLIEAMHWEEHTVSTLFPASVLHYYIIPLQLTLGHSSHFPAGLGCRSSTIKWVGHCQGMGSAFCYARNFISNVSNFRSCWQIVKGKETMALGTIGAISRASGIQALWGGRANGKELRLQSQTCLCSIPALLYFLQPWARASHFTSLCLFPHLENRGNIYIPFSQACYKD